MFKKVVTLLLCICLLFQLLVTSAYAMEIRDGKITVDTVSALPGETVVVSIRIEENPGIMSFATSINYDKEALEYVDYYNGEIFNSFTVKNYPEKGTLRFVFGAFANVYGDGIMISLKFKIKDDATNTLHKVRISNSKGDFSNSDEDIIIPKASYGGVDVKYNGKNCIHTSYNEWKTVGLASCDKAGLQQRFCKQCNHVQSRELAPLGHDFEPNWTIDLHAVKGSDGVMSRHCTRCSTVIDQVTFTYTESETENINNSINATVEASDFTDKLVTQQKPDNSAAEIKPEDTDKQYYKGDEAVPKELKEKLNYYLYKMNGKGIVGKLLEIEPHFEKYFSKLPLFLGIFIYFIFLI